MSIYLLLALAALAAFCNANPTSVQDVCTLPLDKGTCTGWEERWGQSKGVCQKFYYRGCRGNGNNFKTKEECEEACIKPQQSEETEISDVNTRQMNPVCQIMSGPGFVFFNGKDCEWGPGPFYSFDQCMYACNGFDKREIDEPISSLSDQAAGNVPPHHDVCKRPLYTGPCKASVKRYGKKNGVCQEFIYGGCLSNGNNFRTKEKCEEVCIRAQQLEETETSDIQTRHVNPICDMSNGPGRFKYIGFDCVPSSTGPFYFREDCLRSCVY